MKVVNAMEAKNTARPASEETPILMMSRTIATASEIGNSNMIGKNPIARSTLVKSVPMMELILPTGNSCLPLASSLKLFSRSSLVSTALTFDPTITPL
ncbi:hypothetical protein OGAPHI_001368 [Ogataea philodendri]|uniref:Uncharacterized protein n=1 Tax=Ogataea philodendri TaxID=1378263 RepID=A0A9P8PCA9_9ASCO|nr:uncharacterized protein OGAPHI_001368 [Ogataea philodendri]KAH3669247.1 hypothetical protein OGAPHI_001368 [Ogataea philodendri]